MRLIMYVLILGLTIWAGFFLHNNPGNLELSYKDWIIDMPIMAASVGRNITAIPYDLGFLILFFGSESVSKI